MSAAAHKPPQHWSLYVVRREDNALYTGITVDVARRFKQHINGQGAKALRGRSLLLCYQVVIGDRSLALRAEIRFKALSKRRKEQLVAQNVDSPQLLRALALAS